MSAQPARAGFGIGEVLAQLRGEFPDVSVSKIRFLESEGLIQPARSPSNYRRFGPADVARLRYILTAQRDEYLPLRVIKDRLAAAGRGLPRRTWRVAGAAGRPAAAEPPGTARRGRDRRRASWPSWKISAWSGASGRQYGPDALAAARIIAALGRYGVQARHLRAVRAAVEREIGADRAGGGAHPAAAQPRAHGTGPGRRPGRSRRCPCSCTRADGQRAGRGRAGRGRAARPRRRRTQPPRAEPDRAAGGYAGNGFAGPAAAGSGA